MAAPTLIEAVGRNLVARERVCVEAAAGDGDAGGRVVDRVLGAAVGRQQAGEVAVVHGRGRDGVAGVVMPRAGIVNALIAEQEEGLVLAVVDFRDGHRTAERTTPAVEEEVRTRCAGLVQEEVVGPEAGTLEGIVRAAVEGVGPALDADVGDAALGLAELGVEGVGLHLELLHDVGRRHIGRSHFIGIGGRGSGRAINRNVVQVAAGSTHGEVDDMGRLERAIQADAAIKGNAGGESDQQERIPVRERQAGYALGVDHGAEGGALRIQQRDFAGYRDLLFRRADFHGDVDIQAVGNPDFDGVAQRPS